MTEKKMRAAVYNRISTQEQADRGHNLEADTERCKKRADDEKWELVDSYVDPARHGDDANRPQYRRLLTDVAAGLIDIIVIPALDRFGRDSIEIKTKLALFDSLGVKVVSLKENIERETPEGRLQTGILAEFAEFELAKIRARTKAGIAARARTGKPWGEPAYGYQRGEDGHWKPNAYESGIVKRIFREKLEHDLSYNALAALLTRDGIPTRRGTRWTPTVIRRVLTGPAVIGKYTHDGEWFDGRHPAIIDKGDWLKVQALHDQGARHATRGAGRLPTRHIFVRGMLRCGATGCGDAMLPRSAKDQRDVYVCRTHKLDSTACSVPPIPRAVVDAAALKLFEQLALDVAGTREALGVSRDERVGVIEAQLQRSAREVSELTSQLERVERDYLAEELGAAAYDRLTSRITSELDGARAEHTRLSEQAEDVRLSVLALDLEDEVLSRLTELRRFVAGRVNEAAERGDIGALRSAIGSVFRVVVLRPVGHQITTIVGYSESVAPAGQDYWIEPHLRPEMIADEGPHRQGPFSLRKIPLGLANNQTTTGVPE
jgi:site-specific DNA recombinase